MSEKIPSIPFTGTADQEKELRTAIREMVKTRSKSDAVIPALQKAQGVYGYLPIEVQRVVAEELDEFMEKIYGVVTFYSQFSIEPKGKYNVSVCMGTACYVKGAGDVLKEVSKQLGIADGECTDDGVFSLEACRCIGACGLAPVLTINEDVHGRLSVGDIKKVLAHYKE